MKQTILFISLLYFVTTIAGEIGEHDSCTSKLKCHECIRTPDCVWCYQPNYRDEIRCRRNLDIGTKMKCKEEYIWDPSNEFFTIKSRHLSKPRSSEHDLKLSDSGFSSSRGSSQNYNYSDITIIQPQHIQMKLNARDSYFLKMQYTQAEDYPVDIYLIMDLSGSIESDKEKLAKLGELLVNSIGNITSNIRIGLGSLRPCEDCAGPYVFRNIMSLSHKTSYFVNQVKVALFYRNSNATEGMFDAVMQAVVCKNQIGWRRNARKILLFATANSVNFPETPINNAKLNDGFCHLDSEGIYTHSAIQSSPNISQIHRKVRENFIDIIFAVNEGHIHNYSNLQNDIYGSSITTLSFDNSNVIDLVRDLYMRISSSVEMKDNATDRIQINYYSRCLNSTAPLQKTNKCINMKVGDTVTFTIEFTYMSCPKDPKEWTKTIQIYPVGVNASLIVNFEMICSCPCEIPGHQHYQVKAPQCHGSGTYKCGICECDRSYFGRYCECSAGDQSLMSGTSCSLDNKSQICSGRGSCVCGHCLCNTRDNIEEVISGRYCECDNFSCDRHNGMICSGPDHGVCNCGQCFCTSPWSGSACECNASNNDC